MPQQLMRFTFSVDTVAIRSKGLIKSGSIKRSFFPGSCVKKTISKIRFLEVLSTIINKLSVT